MITNATITGFVENHKAAKQRVVSISVYGGLIILTDQQHPLQSAIIRLSDEEARQLIKDLQEYYGAEAA